MKTRFASSYGGFAWNIGVPLLNAITTVLVFSILMSGRMGERYGDVGFPLFFFVPFVLWTMFNETVGKSTSAIKDHSYLITKVAFPAWVLPLVPFVSSLISQAIFMLLIIGLFLLSGSVPSMTVFYLIPLWMICAVFTIGISYFVSAFATYLSDVAQAVPIILNIFFWLTPILYPPALVSEAGGGLARSIIMTYNPMYHFVELSRQLTFSGHSSPWASLGGLTLFSLIVLTIGVGTFKRLERGFSDVV